MKARIALVLHGSPAERMGGTGLYVQALAYELADHGHPVAIVSPNPGKKTDGTPIGRGVESWKIGLPSLERWSDTWNQTTEPWKDWCDDWKPDIIHFHHLSGWPLGLTQASPCRTIMTLHDYAVPCARGQLVTGDLQRCDGPSPANCSACLAPSLRTNPITMMAGRLLSYFPKVRQQAVKAVARLPAPGARQEIEQRLIAAKQALESVDVLLAPSLDLASRMKTMGFRVPDHSPLPLLHPAPTPIDPGKGPTRFLFASSIIPTKGPDRLVEAWEKLQPDASLTIAGHAPTFDGYPDYGTNLQARAVATPNVHWVGAVKPDQVPALMDCHDVLVLPSKWPENSPLVIREATAHGLHVIAHENGGAHELAPSATLINDTDESLYSAVRHHTEMERKRAPAKKWPSTKEHVQELLKGPYSSVQA
jgi:glycosyltransferase involved in cell wall biosynthesis